MATIATAPGDASDTAPGGRGGQLLNRYATVATIVTFAVTAATGVMLFFHVGVQYVKGAHEWLSMAFVVASAFHLLRHSKTFMNLLRAPRTRIALVFMAAVAAVFVVAASLYPDPHDRSRHDRQTDAAPAVEQTLERPG